MPDFGISSSVAPLASSGLASAWAVHVRGSAASISGVVHAVDPASLLLQGRRFAVEQRRLLDAAREQRELADHGATHWMPVEELSESAEHAYWRRAYLPWSAERLALTEHPLTSGQLRGLMIAVAQGLSELDERARRPFGNLTSATVLLRKSPGDSGFAEDLTAGTGVLLTDLKPRDTLGPRAAAYDADLRAMGRLIFELVNFRKAPPRALLGPGWTAEPSAEWNRFGDGAWWLDFANRLMNAGGVSAGDRSADKFDLEAALAELITHEPAREPVRTGKIVALTAAVLIGVGGVSGGAVWYSNHLDQIRQEQARELEERTQRWRTLCDRWNTWFAGLWNDSNALRTAAAAPGAPEIHGQLLALLSSPGVDSPQHIANRDDGLLGLKDTPGVALEPQGVAATIATLAAIDRGEALLKNWDTRRELRETASAWNGRGWPALAMAPGLGSERVQESLLGNVPLLAAVRDTLAIAARCQGVQNKLQEISEAQTLAGERLREDDVLSRLNDAAAGEMELAQREAAELQAPEAGEVLDVLEKRLQPVWAGAMKARAFAAGEIVGWDARSFRASEAYTALANRLGPDREPMTEAMLEAWLAEAGKPLYLPPPVDDPRPAYFARIIPRLSMLDRGVARLRELGAGGAELVTDTAADERNVRALRDEVASLEALAWSRATRETIESRLRGLEVALDGRTRELEESIATASMSVAQLIAAQPRDTFKSRTLTTAWTAFLRGLDATRSKREVMAQIRGVRDGFGNLERELSAVPSTPAMNGIDGSVLPALVEAQRERAIAALADRVRAAGSEHREPKSDASTADIAAEIAKARQGLQEWHGRALEHLRAWSGVWDQLDTGALYLAGEGVPPAIAPRWERVASLEREASSPGPAADVKGASRPVRERVESLRALARLNDAETLVAETVGGAAGARTLVRRGEAVTALDRLARMGWPSATSDLPKAIAARDRVIASLRETPAGVREAAEVAEAAGPALWTNMMNGREEGDARGLEAAMNAAAALGAREETKAALPAPARFNALVWTLLQELKATDRAMREEGKNPEEVSATQREAQRARVASMYDQLRLEAREVEAASGPNPSISGLLEGLRSIVARDVSAEFDPLREGPGAMRTAAGRPVWSGRMLPGGAVLFTLVLRLGEEGGTPFGPARAITIEFRPIETEGPGGTIRSWISTGEVSVGIFWAIVEAAGTMQDDPILAWEQGREVLRFWTLQKPDGRQGPAPWTWDARRERIIVSDRKAGMGWLRGHPTMGEEPYYPAGMDVKPPTADTPMTWVGPDAALWAARLSNCRLPGVDEWKAALALSHATGHDVERHGAEGPLPNRRGAEWKRQHTHVLGLGASGKEFPSEGAFWPKALRPQSAQPGGKETYVRSLDDSALEIDDGVLWLRETGAGKGAGVGGGVGGGVGAEGFENLVGNVAEWVVMGDPREVMPGPGLEAVRAAVDDNAARLRVIGASALTGIVLRGGVAYDVQEPYEPISLREARLGYADVGFRLAYGEPGPGRPKLPPASLALVVLESTRSVQTRR